MKKVMGNSLKTNLQPRIYVACLAAYNIGYLHDAWIDAAQEPWCTYDDVKAMLAASPFTGAAVSKVVAFGPRPRRFAPRAHGLGHSVTVANAA